MTPIETPTPKKKQDAGIKSILDDDDAPGPGGELIETTMEPIVVPDVKKAAVLGVKRGLDYAVLGKRRRPVTGDSVESLIWVLLMTMACGSMITSVVMLTAGKSPNKK